MKSINSSKLVKLGTNYGGWIVPSNLELDENSVIYSGGVGEDISFDLILSSKYNCNIFLIDPTKRSLVHYEEIQKYYIKNDSKFSGDIQKDYIQNIYNLTPKFDKIKYINKGLWDIKTQLKFFKPIINKYVSHSLIEGMTSKNYDLVDVDSIKNIMESNNHTHIDLLKLDIEGAEIKVLDQMLKDEILPTYLLVEFDLFLQKKDKNNDTNRILKELNKYYTILKNDNYNITFKKKFQENNLWNIDTLKLNLKKFSDLYKERPILDNNGGMKSPHMYYFYFVVNYFKFKNIIESGVWKGQGTWLMDQIKTVKKIMSIDINPRFINYRSKKATYFSKDFKFQNFALDKDETLCFFDDHQNAYERLIFCKKKGYKHIIFEDNYPLTKGDCLSIKKIIDLYNNRNTYLAKSEHHGKFEPSLDKLEEMYNFIKTNVKYYYEFPPIFKNNKTRWNTDWDFCPVKPPLFDDNEDSEYLNVFKQDKLDYTYILYLQL